MYTVLFFSSTVLSAQELEEWLNARNAEGLRLVAITGSLYVFERNVSKPIIYQNSNYTFKFPYDTKNEHNTPD